MSKSAAGLSEATDFNAILSVLVQHRVDFVIIGSVAVAYHGYVRGTKDVDIVVAPDHNNLRLLWAALQALEAQPLQPDDVPKKDWPVDLTLEGLCLGANWLLMTKHGRLDVLQYIEDKLETPADYKQLKEGAEAVQFDYGCVYFVGYADLIDLKNLAGRPDDERDIRALYDARKER